MESATITYIDSNETLQQVCAHLRKCEVIAVDTEFFRETTYYPVAALIQLYAGSDIFIVDCLRVDAWHPLSDVFKSNDCLKVLHSSSEDLEIFRQLLGCEPAPLVDTQIAAAIAGHGFSMGYQNLVSKLLSVDIDKEQTRSDWLQRPLSEKQIHYAANDVRWLLAVWHQLRFELEDVGRLDWCLQDCEALMSPNEMIHDWVDNAYLRVKAAWRLNAQQLNILKTLCAWREEMAQLKDVPRSRIISDACAMELAQRQPLEMSDLYRLQQLRSSSRREHGEAIIQQIATAREMDKNLWPDRLADKSAPPFRRKLKVLRSLVADEARAHNLPPELLGRKKELEQFLESPESSRVMHGWRGEILREKIVDLI